MNLEQWQQAQLEVKAEDIKLGLISITAVAKSLNLQHITTPIITVAGTNGKGSTIAMLAQICQQLNLTTGVYTSPHLVNYTERIKINGVEIKQDLLCEYFSRIKKQLNQRQLSYFEYGTLAAIMAFVAAKVEVIILEVGLGGRLDAANAWPADIGILTNIDLDHQAWLGNTREKIGLEKAGIFRSHKPAIIGTSNCPQSVITYAQKISAKIKLPQITKLKTSWQFEIEGINFNNLDFPVLNGEFQLNNAACAISAAYYLAANKLTIPIINQALTSASIKGRLQTVNYKNRQFLLDVAHNPAAILGLKNYLANRKIVAIFGVMADKDIDLIIKIISPNIVHWCLFPLPIERATTCENLKTRLLHRNSKVTVHSNLPDAIELAMQSSLLIGVFGSFVTVAEFLKFSE